MLYIVKLAKQAGQRDRAWVRASGQQTLRQVKETIDAALESGINLLDVFMPGKAVRENIAKALGARRQDVMIQGHIGSTDLNQQYDISRDLPTVKRYFEDLPAA